MALQTQPSAMPTRKVTWMTFAVLGSSIAADLLIGFIPEGSRIDPGELELLIEAMVVTVVTSVTGYVVRERA